ncbi:carboxypeptidase regulatory-like domain-containing protein [Archangium violaceum]|uniref:carboxypeptidase-like regulatory domain-containing protein n=1 Tax=Archangium violaceum TaxID=83451 RepID=UPI00195136C6|nr:carboxypeptidase-like regulatory domain-containing protein [Archangium violaceum]QRN92815.1 carboxypeptidase regulatory-like domain-containing protein [Archangium violaceum]
MHQSIPRILEFVDTYEGEAPVHAEAITAGDGTFVLEGLSPGAFALWVLGEHGAVMRTGVPAGVDGVELRLEVGLTLEGIVLGEQTPLADARVTVIHAGHTRFFETRTGSDGRFRIGPLPASRYLLAVSAEGWMSGLFTAGVLNALAPQLELIRPRRLTGRVLSGGAPVPGVQVILESRFPTEGDVRPVRTDGEGRFRFEPLASGEYRLTAEQAGRFAFVQLVLEEDTPWPDEVVLQLGEAFFQEGTVREKEGHPVPGARVIMSHLETRGWARHTLTGPDGRYRLGPLQPGLHELRVEAERYRREIELEHALERGSGPLDFTLERAASVLGTVVDKDGQPLPNIELSMLYTGRSHGSALGHVVSDEAGRFAFDPALPGSYMLSCQDESMVSAHLFVQAPAEGLRWVLSRGGSVSGTLTDAQGIPLTQGQVVLWDLGETGGWEEREEVDEAGRFLIQGIRPGRYMLEARVPSASVERSTAHPVEVKEEEQVEVSLRLETGWTLSGVVVDGTGRPVEGATLQASPSSLPPWRQDEEYIQISSDDAPAAVRSGPDGRFTLRYLVEDAYDVSVSKEGHRPPGEATRVNAGTPEVRFVLERLGHIRGRLVDPTGAPITRFEVNGESRRDLGGAFAVPFTESGIQTLTLTASGMAPVRRPVPVTEGLDVDLGELRMGPGRRVRGRILDAETSEPVSASLRFTDATLESTKPTAGVWESVEVKEDGTFELPHVEARPLTLLVEDEGHWPRRLTLDARTEEVTVRLEAGARIEVRVSDARGGLVGADLDFERDEGGGRGIYAPEGTYVLTGLEPGNYTVRLRPLEEGTDPLFFRPRRVQVPASGRVSLSFEGEQGGATVRVRVKDEEDIRSVWIRPGGAPPITKDFDLERALSGGLTGSGEGESDEWWVLRHVPPGRATLLILADADGPPFHLEELEIPSEGTVTREVRPVWREGDGEED